MNNISAYTLYSGSSGNCIYCKTPDVELLIDAGVSARAVEKALREIGTSLSRITAIFVTHEHTDHTRGLEVISKKHHIPTHMMELSARALIHDPHASLLGDLYLHPSLFSVQYGETVIRSFATPHDSADAVGYTVEYTPKDGVSEKIGVATDIGHVDESILQALSGANAAVIEANHDVQMLLTGPYPYSLKRRILSESGHLSNEMAAMLARKLASDGTNRFVLAHLSKENNYPPTAEAAVRTALAGFDKASLAVASPDTPTKIL